MSKTRSTAAEKSSTRHGETPRAVLFDAYGTLFDVYSIGALADSLYPGNGPAIATLWLARKFIGRIGGYTGDCLGAIQQVTEVVFYLSLLASIELSGDQDADMMRIAACYEGRRGYHHENASPIRLL